MKCKCPNCNEEINISIFLNRQVEQEPEETNQKENPVLRTIAEIVCENAGISITELRSHLRIRKRVKARQQYMWLAKNFSGCTLLEIGRFIREGMDHTTVVHGIGTIRDLIESYPQEEREMMYLADRVNEKILTKAS